MSCFIVGNETREAIWQGINLVYGSLGKEACTAIYKSFIKLNYDAYKYRYSHHEGVSNIRVVYKLPKSCTLYSPSHIVSALACLHYQCIDAKETDRTNEILGTIKDLQETIKVRFKVDTESSAFINLGFWGD